MKVFVSHSMKDQSILNGIVQTLRKYGLKLLVAEHQVDLGVSITEKIKSMIERSNVGLVLLTKNGIKSGFVREEIGYLTAKRKATLMVIEKGVESQYGGFKFGHDYIIFDPLNPQETIDKVKEILMNHWLKVSERQKIISEEQRRKSNNQALVGLGVLAGLLILASNE
ncbi:MAG: toll/interleukin-1 receptor domain-containing protein [Bacteroidia bacterium]|nr:toll/interleukin-1 receptor domain-containing protein [Bacteroidia bacterium]